MNTKIGGFDSSPVPISTGRNVKRSSDAVTSSGAARSSDTQITESARGLAGIEQALLASPAVDDLRVESVRGRLADGSYQINSERIADKLLRAEQDALKLE